jgi:spore coat protein B
VAAFRQYLRDLVGKYVQLERSGPEACQGWVFTVGQDYVTLSGFDGSPLHVPLQHIRSVTAFPDLGEDPPRSLIAPEDCPDTFDELLARYVGRRVRLNHGGPEVSAGTLLAFGDDYLLIEIAPGCQVCHARFHLRSLCPFLACEPSSEGYIQGGI